MSKLLYLSLIAIALLTPQCATAAGPATTMMIMNNSNMDVVFAVETPSDSFRHWVPLRAGRPAYDIPIRPTKSDQFIIAYKGKRIGSRVEKAMPLTIVGFHRFNISQFVFPEAYVEFVGGEEVCESFIVPLNAEEATSGLAKAMKNESKVKLRDLIQEGAED